MNWFRETLVTLSPHKMHKVASDEDVWCNQHVSPANKPALIKFEELKNKFRNIINKRIQSKVHFEQTKTQWELNHT